MKQIDYILKLILAVDKKIPWLDKAKEILHATDARAVYEEPGKMSARDILADSRIRLKSLVAANCVSTGFDELIHVLEKLNFEEELLCYGFASNSLSLIGNCYVTEDGILLGCAWVPRPCP